MRRGIVWAAIAVAVATIVAYVPALRAPFLFDDLTSITESSSIQSLWPPSTALHPARQITVSGRPVVNYTLAVNYAVNRWLGVDQRPDPDGPDKTVGYHVVNLLLHLLCGALLFGILRRTIESVRARPPGDEPWSALEGLGATDIAMAVTAIWLLHPIQTEAVDYVVQRTELLMSACYLGTLYTSIRAWDASDARARLGWSAAAVAVCLLGMGCKEVMITAPLAVVLYDRAFRLRSWRQVVSPGEGRPWLYALLLATSLWSIALIAGGPRNETVGFDLGMTWYAYLYSQAWAILHYIRLVFWPDGLTLDYGQRPIMGLSGVPGAIVLTAFLVATVVAWTKVERWGWFAFLGALFFMILAPSSSIVPISTEIAAERRIYLALAPLLVLALVGVVALARRLDFQLRKRGLRWAVGVIGMLLASLTFMRSSVYASSESIWRDVTVEVPRNPRGYAGLGIALLGQGPAHEADAEALFRQAIAVDSTYAPPYYQLAEIALRHGRPVDAKSLLERAVAADPHYGRAIVGLGGLLLHMGDPQSAIPLLERAAGGAPNEQPLVDLGDAYMATDRLDDASRAYRSALARNPSRVDVLTDLGALLTEQGRAAQAIELLEQAVRLEGRGVSAPASPGASPGQSELGVSLGLLSLAYADAGRGDEAATAASRAVASPGADARVFVFAGQAMLRANRGTDAEAYLTRAIQLGAGNPEVVTALGDAKVAVGKRSEAADLFRHALAMQPNYTPARQALDRLAAAGRPPGL